ncbi:MAG: pyridoxamine 5'-phosphate oxidase, partial [Candidatus Latescibacteria bacterium]|nr:pyridoxamine 5'-phosphate oxidase [Candidatus Latescibacterota bacterium]
MNPDPFVQFDMWFEEAKASELTLPEAVALATATSDGRPSVRMVLVKQCGQDGFVFFTNLESRKVDELAENPRAALLFHWKSLGRQVRIEGTVEAVSDEVSRAYFDSRPRGSRLSAWASPQSKKIPDRAFLEDRVAELDRKYPGEDVPLPDFWGGYRVIPDQFEFWVNRDDRLHDRFLYVRQADGAWKRALLAP